MARRVHLRAGLEGTLPYGKDDNVMSKVTFEFYLIQDMIVYGKLVLLMYILCKNSNVTSDLVKNDKKRGVRVGHVQIFVGGNKR